MKIYTKTGDKGTTALVGGSRVAKNNKRIEAYGTTDELVSYLALLADHDIGEEYKKVLEQIKEELMVVSSILACESEQVLAQLPKLSNESVVNLEKLIDRITSELPVLKAFLIPGGHTAVSVCHICRTICRRAERRVYDIMDEEKVPEIISQYLNRLSDFLFVLARKLSMIFNVDEIIWKPVLEK